ncbi:MAG: amino acid ABC transporter substrate-binding protein [Ignavibacteriae bacterium]|nr:amino acid ABC transporter substrate-binding protein [Ignavibacteriota bacterium]
MLIQAKWKLLFWFLFFSFIVLNAHFSIPNILSSKVEIFEGRNTIIIVGDFSKQESFGNMIRNGVDIAINEEDNKNYKIIFLNITENLVSDVSPSSMLSQTAELIENVKDNLIKVIASDKVVGIIAANTSQSITGCLEIGKLYNIPVLITIATADDILIGYEKIAFRLLANNKKQIEEIVKWSKTSNLKNNKDLQLGILYSPTTYGFDLLQQLQVQIGINHIIPFSISTTTDLVGTLNYGKQIGINGWIAFSYQQDAKEILIKKSKLKMPEPILFSDGAYGRWLEEIKYKKNVLLSFPDNNTIDTLSKKKLHGYSIFGYDAFRILKHSIEKLIFNHKRSKQDLVETISTLKNDDKIQAKLINKYSFINGQNVYAKFRIYNMLNDKLP